MKRFKDWFVDDYIPWLIDEGWVYAVLGCVVMVLATSDVHCSVNTSSKFHDGQEVRLKVNGSKGVVVRRVGSEYLVRYAEQDGRLNAIPMNEDELIPWPSSYQTPTK